MKYFTLKEGVDDNDFMEISPLLLNLFSSFVLWSTARGLPVRITSIKDDAVSITRVSNTHETGRAIDISAKGWTSKDIEEAVTYFNKEFKSIGAITREDHKPRPIIYHNAGTGYHFHLQVRSLDSLLGD